MIHSFLHPCDLFDADVFPERNHMSYCLLGPPVTVKKRGVSVKVKCTTCHFPGITHSPEPWLLPALLGLCLPQGVLSLLCSISGNEISKAFVRTLERPTNGNTHEGLEDKGEEEPGSTPLSTPHHPAGSYDHVQGPVSRCHPCHPQSQLLLGSIRRLALASELSNTTVLPALGVALASCSC